MLDAGTAQERKALVRSFLAGIRVQKATRQAVLEWFRLPQAVSAKLVELRRAELEGWETEAEIVSLPTSHRGRPEGCHSLAGRGLTGSGSGE